MLEMEAVIQTVLHFRSRESSASPVRLHVGHDIHQQAWRDTVLEFVYAHLEGFPNPAGNALPNHGYPLGGDPKFSGRPPVTTQSLVH